MIDLFSDLSLEVGERGRLLVPVDGYGHLWLRILLPCDSRLR